MKVKMPVTCRQSAHASRKVRSRRSTPQKSAAVPVRARRRLPVSRHRGDIADRRGSARPLTAAHRARALRSTDLAGGRCTLGTCPAAAGTAGHRHARHPHRRGDPQRDDPARGLRRIDESSAARPRHRACCGSAASDACRVGERESRGSTHRRCTAQRPTQLRDGAGLSCRRCTGGHAASAPRRPARHKCVNRNWRHARTQPRLVGAERATSRAQATPPRS